MRALIIAAAIVMHALLIIPAAAIAQAPPMPHPHPEVRADVIAAGDHTSTEVGAGMQIPAGYYARIGVIGAVGSEFSSGSTHASGRVDIVGRFLIDPFRQQTWGLSGGAGISLRARSGDRIRPLILAVLDLEGPRSVGALSPALQLGLGGGVRIGGVMRWSASRSR